MSNKVSLEELKKLIEDTVDAKVKTSNAPRGEVKDWIESVMGDQYRSAQKPKEKGQGFARMLAGMAATKGNPEAAAKYVLDKFHDEAVAKALTSDSVTAGGVFVPEDFSSEVVELLRAQSVVRRAGPRFQNMPNGTLTIARMTGGATAEWIGESTSQNASQPTTDSIRLVEKKLRATVPISNELLRFADVMVQNQVRDDAVDSLATQQDKDFLRGDGTEHSPKGFLNFAANSTGTNGTTLANIDQDILDLLNDLDGANVANRRRVIFMSTREFNKLRTERTSNDVPAFPTVVNDGELYGIPIFPTNNIPTNLGAGSDESEVYLVEMSDVIIGEASELEIVTSDQATYTDSSGSLVSAFDRDETVMKVIERMDMAVRHPEAVAVKTAVKWGA